MGGGGDAGFSEVIVVTTTIPLSLDARARERVHPLLTSPC